MPAELLSVEAGAWHALLERAAHDFYHLPAYVSLAAETEGGRPCALRLYDDEGEVLLPLVERMIPGEGLCDLASPYGYPGPLFSESGAAAQAGLFVRNWPDALTLLGSRGCVSMFVRLHPLLSAPLETLQDYGTLVAHGHTVSIDLTLSLEAQWKDMRATTRNALRRAEKTGVRPEADPSCARLREFSALYRTTLTRLGAEPRHMFSEDYFVALRQALGERLVLWTLDIDGSLAGAGLFTEVAGVVQYHLSASDPRFAKEQPAKIILNSVRHWAHARGNRSLHLGGGVGSTEDSLFFFKAGFSSLRHRFHTWRVIIDAAAYAKWSGADHNPDGFFPAYRRESTRS